MIALNPVFSSSMKCSASWASKSGKPQGVVMTTRNLALRKKKMGRSTGLEPATLGTTNRCSNQLSYDRHGFWQKEGLLPRRHLRVRGREGKDGAADPLGVDNFR